jgi:hypothetical protein
VAQEVGSFLSNQDLTTCTTQLCVKGVMFVSVPLADIQTTPTTQLHALISHKLKIDPTSIATEVVRCIEFYLARRPHIPRVFPSADESEPMVPSAIKHVESDSRTVLICVIYFCTILTRTLCSHLFVHSDL